MIILTRAQALRRALTVLLCGVCAGAVLAAPLTTSPRPLMKPELASQATPAEAIPEVAAETPPDLQAEARAALLAQQIESASALAIALSQRPLARPDGLKTALSTPEAPVEVPPAASIPQPIERGQLCGIAGLEGRPIADVPAKSRGCGLEEGVQMGPLANPRRPAALTSLIGNATAHGSRLLTGGAAYGEGFFFQPTLLADVPNEAAIMNTEPFGPVAVTRPFATLDEVIAEANRGPFGLAAFAFTNDLRTANLVGDALEAGMVGINSFAISVADAPFGGVKESGFGSEGGTEGLDSYMVVKAIHQA